MASVAIATNLPFSEWGTVFPDPRLVPSNYLQRLLAAIISDRLLLAALIAGVLVAID